jgi:FtsP/CotA-like multicopper oxidase with cupredoxin domain
MLTGNPTFIKIIVMMLKIRPDVLLALLLRPVFYFSYLFFLSAIYIPPGFGQVDTTVYHITLRQETVNKTGRAVTGMTINGTIPGPVLRFNEGDYAVIYVENQMDEETSIHWHGFLLPNFFDGVPYLNTPPIMPGDTFKYEFQLRQTGTFWYHSHTMLQEEIGVFGAFVIDEEDDPLDYDRDLVLVVSDWTNEKPMTILRNLKRGNEWYDIKKGTDTPLNQVIARGALGAQFNFWRQRMGGADISDVAYSGFLMNGEETRDYPEFDPGERIRLRVINASASSNYWLTFGGGDPVLVSADGLNVEPVRREKTFIAVAETYDFIVTIPENGKIEFRATVQDGSGTTSAFLGQGDILPATDIERPDKIGMMMEMAEMDMRMGAPGMKFRPGREEPHKMRDKWGMDMDHHADDHNDHDDMDMNGHDDMDDHDDMEMDMDMDDHDHMEMDENGNEGHDKNGHKGEKQNDGKGHQTGNRDRHMHDDIDNGHHGDDHEDMNGMDMFAEFSYDFLRSPESTAFPEDAPVREILLNLTGNMSRYVWSMNGIPLAEAGEIRIRKEKS